MKNKNTKRQISIVIPCYKDRNIVNLVNMLESNSTSIEREYVIVLVKEDKGDIESDINNLGLSNIKIVYAKKGNLSKSFNLGIKESKYRYILLLNSDLVEISNNYLGKMLQESQKADVVKSNIIFLHNNFITKIISKSRALGHVNTAYNPGLLVRKDVFNTVGLFNENIHFAEDDEFNYRLKKNNVSFIFCEKNYIKHPAINIKHDLKMAYFIGAGTYQATKYTGKDDYNDISSIIRRVITLKTFSKFKVKVSDWGLETALYDIVWALFYYLGNYKERFVRNEK